MKKEMLINVLQSEESRIAILEDGVLEELYVERSSIENCVGNIYKGRVVNIEPSIQAVFVDFGVGRNGFLHVSDVEYQYYKHLLPNGGKADDEEDPRYQRGRRRFNERSVRNKPPIQEIFRRGNEVLVQVIKEGIGTKGPTLSTYISIPGRYLVLMPGLQRVGVCRKIEDDDLRRKLRQVLLGAQSAAGAGLHHPHRRHRPHQARLAPRPELSRAAVEDDRPPHPQVARADRHLRRKRHDHPHDPRHLHQRDRRDLIDEPQAYERAHEFMKIVMPRYVNRIKLYEGKEPLFHKYHIDEEIARIQSRHVPLRGGGSIVIDQTEALVAIDVNSGNFRADDNAEETAYQMNLRAAEEIGRQIRLRDLGGVIVNDFIDMREERHRRGVERALREAVRRDRARTKILRISPFGLIEMTRQRIRPSLRRSIYEDCPCCHSTGLVKTAESMAIETMRLLMTRATREGAARLVVEIHDRVANYLNNKKRREITGIEESCKVTISIIARSDVGPEHLLLKILDEGGNELRPGAPPSWPKRVDSGSR